MDSSSIATHGAQPADKHSFDTKLIWRTFWILLAITVFELIVAIIYYETAESGHPFMPKHVLNGLFVIMTLAKAFFIIAEFMHLRHEIRNMIMTVAVPALLFVWFVLAFVLDGNSYLHMREKFDRYKVEQSKTKVPVHHEEGKKPGVE